MVTAATKPSLDDVRRAVESVPDPELPPVSLGMLGMVHDVRVDDDGAVAVELLPTFAGCPATDMIGEDVKAAVGAVDGVGSVSVRFRFDPPWTADRISDEGREALREFGITPPVRLEDVPTAPQGRGLPVVVTRTQRVCPYCGSTETDVDSPFGPTPCRSINFCNRCRQPFEAFKD
jgi:ring-1,2-phenylacetyl-CoA epoxidase subunit PaaD